MKTTNLIGWMVMCIAILVCLMFMLVAVFAHDFVHPEEDAWYAWLMQPDNPAVSCCGKSDAYWCDDISVVTEKDINRLGQHVQHVFCAITDDRNDSVQGGRKHRPLGEMHEIPPNKMKFSDSDPQRDQRTNPTGHNIIFLSKGDYVYCFVPGSGV